jgi:hypothetical protein
MTDITNKEGIQFISNILRIMLYHRKFRYMSCIYVIYQFEIYVMYIYYRMYNIVKYINIIDKIL